MNSLVVVKEKIYFALCLIISFSIYTAILFQKDGIVTIIMTIVFPVITHGFFMGRLIANSIRVSEKQFPQVHDVVTHFANLMDITPVPAVYVMQAGGVLNAFATHFLGKNFIVIYSDVLELAYEKGESELAFIICHELAHIQRKHISLKWLIYPAILIPFLGSAYSRACEYTCDKYAAYYVPQAAITGLLVLAAGKKLYRNIDAEEFSHQITTESSCWVWLFEIMSTHPSLPKRINALTAQKYPF